METLVHGHGYIGTWTCSRAHMFYTGDYSIEENAWWSERVYSQVMRLLNEYDVMLDGILLKPNM